MTAFPNKWKRLLIDFFSASQPNKDNKDKNKDSEPLTTSQIYGKLTRRQLHKHAFDHNLYEIHAIIEDMAEEMKDQIRLHGGEVEEPKKLTRSGIGEIIAHFNGK